MKKLALIAFALLASAVSVSAQTSNNPVPPNNNAAAYNSAAPTCTSGLPCWMQTDVNGNLKVVGGGAGGTTPVSGATSNASSGVAPSATNVPNVSYNYWWNGATWDQAPGTAANGGFVQGSVASATTDSGNPVKIGGLYSIFANTVAAGQRVDLATDSRGKLGVVITSNNGASTVNTPSGAADGISGATFGLQSSAWGYSYNGATWDRSFTCPNTAVINVTAAATTEIVPLTAAQTIRVCSFVITESLAGTATFVNGTGTNCGTGTTSLTGAMAMVTGGNISVSSGNGSVLRTASGSALCLTAATGNVTGFVTYAKY